MKRLAATALLLAALTAPVQAADADSDMTEGFAKSRAGSWAEAAPLLRRAFDADPTRAHVAAELGFVLFKLGQLRDAETVLRRAIALDPRASYPYLSLGEVLAEAPDRWRRREEIVAFLERGLQALKDEPGGRAWLTLRLAGVERSVGMLPQANRRLAALLASPDVPARLRQLALELREQISADGKAQGLEDWPDGPPLAEADRVTVKRAEAFLRDGQSGRAADTVTPVLGRVPESVDARWLRARAFDDLGRYEQARRDLTILLQLRPSHAAGWRRLGKMLAERGGSLDAEAADEALRHALALEPSWDDLRVLRRRVAAKRGPIDERKPPPARPAPAPTEHALKLLTDAQRWTSDAPELAEPLITQALAESPGYVDAAATMYAMTGQVPEATVRALWDDPDGLIRLAGAVQVIGGRPTSAVVRCLDRAVDLGSAEGRWRRAELRALTGDRAGALADLTDYVAREPNPVHLDEARAMRATLVPTESAPQERQAFLALLAERVQEAERLLGGPCRRDLPSARLVELGRVQEYAGATPPALECYRLAVEAASKLQTPTALRAAQTRLAAAAARAPVVLLPPLETALRAAHRAQIPTAAWALARLEQERGQLDEARIHLESFLAAAPSDDPAVTLAATALATLTEGDRVAATRRLGLGKLAGLTLVVLLAIGIARRFRGTTVSRALARRPALFPELSRAVAEVRHDVIKHRASVLGMGDDEREGMARVLLEPQPASELVAEIYAPGWSRPPRGWA